MRAVTKILCVILGAGMLLCVCGSCTSTSDTTPTPTATATPTEPIVIDTSRVIFDVGSAPLTVVRSDYNTDKCSTQAMRIKRAITELSGVECGIETDWVQRGTEPTLDAEILVGKTNRPASEEALEGIEAGGVIRVIDEKLVINGTNEMYLTMAMDAFIEKYLSGNYTRLSYSMIKTEIITFNGVAEYTGEEFDININDETYGGAQFVTKLYTEGYGRAPSAEEYRTYYEYINDYGCVQDTLVDLAVRHFSADAFKDLHLTDKEGAFALYRAILNRDPVASEIAAFSMDDVKETARTLAESKEFGKMVSDINRGNYGWGHNNRATYTGTQVYTSAQINEMLAEKSVVELPQGSLVLCTEAVNLGGGKTLRTEGNPTTALKMARFLRICVGGWAIVELNGDGNLLEAVWMDGNRGDIGLGDGGNCWVCGSNNTVRGCKMSDTIASTNMATVAIFQNVQVLNNLITCYTTNNYANWADGITFQARGRIEGNTVIDATDVAIILFREWTNDPQDTVVINNTAISAGNSCFAAYHTDAWMDESLRDFSGCLFQNNAAWTSMKTHFNIVFSLASTAWHYNGNVAKGASMIGNYTPEGLYAVCGVGIAVDSMKGATVHGNSLHVYIADVEGRFGTHLIANNQSNYEADVQTGYENCPMHDGEGSYIGCRENVMGPVWHLKEGVISEDAYPVQK